jgi:hypothetical protein
MKPEGIRKRWTLTRIWLDSTKTHKNPGDQGRKTKH